MAERTIRYIRKLSGEEAQRRFILVKHESLKLFPPVNSPFQISIGGKNVETTVKLVEVWNQGEKRPHFDYHIDLSKYPALYRPTFKSRVTLTRNDQGIYELSMESLR